MLSAITNRQVPRIAPRILLSSKESIESAPGPSKWNGNTQAGNMPAAGDAADREPVSLASGNPYKASYERVEPAAVNVRRRYRGSDPGPHGLDALARQAPCRYRRAADDRARAAPR